MNFDSLSVLREFHAMCDGKPFEKAPTVRLHALRPPPHTPSLDAAMLVSELSSVWGAELRLKVDHRGREIGVTSEDGVA